MLSVFYLDKDRERIVASGARPIFPGAGLLRIAFPRIDQPNMYEIKHLLRQVSAKVPLVLGLGLVCLASDYLLHFVLRKLLTSPQPNEHDEL